MRLTSLLVALIDVGQYCWIDTGSIVPIRDVEISPDSDLMVPAERLLVADSLSDLDLQHRIRPWTAEKDTHNDTADPDKDEPIRHELVALAQIVTITALLYAIYC